MFNYLSYTLQGVKASEFRFYSAFKKYNKLAKLILQKRNKLSYSILFSRYKNSDYRFINSKNIQ